MRNWCAFLAIVSGFASANADTQRSRGGVVYVNDVPVLRFMKQDSTGQSPEQKADTAAEKLGTASDPKLIRLFMSGDSATIYSGKVPVVTLQKAEARAQHSTVKGLATRWVTNIRGALTQTGMRIDDDYIRLPLGGVRVVPIRGKGAFEANYTTSNDALVSFRKVAGGLEVTGKSAGKAQISVNWGTQSDDISLDIKPNAAEFPQAFEATVTGAPAISQTIFGSIVGAIKTQLKAKADSKISVRTFSPGSIGVGAMRTYDVFVDTSAPDCFPNGGLVRVKVTNLALPRLMDDVLWYSNDPESVKGPGHLFSGEVERGSSIRLLYHHSNISSSNLVLRVQAINDSDKPARVVLIPGDASPNRDPVRAGLAAADQFIRGWMYGSGEVVTIPPGQGLPIAVRQLSTGETMSGLTSIRLIDGPDSLLIRTDAWLPFNADVRWVAALRSGAPWRDVGANPLAEYDKAPMEPSAHVYPNPVKTESVDYSVGGRYGFLRIGQEPIIRKDNDGALDGNFGVIYNIKAKLQNLTNEATEVEVVYEASAGYSGGLFILNGQLMRTPLLHPKQETRLLKVRLAPGASRSYDIMTLPLSGSSYPATLTVRPVSGGA